MFNMDLSGLVLPLYIQALDISLEINSNIYIRYKKDNFIYISDLVLLLLLFNVIDIFLF